MISFDTQWKRIVGNDCSGVKYGMSASLGLYWSDQTCALLNGAVTGIRVWGLPTINWVRGWVLEKESRQWHFKFELLSYMFVYRRLTYTICQLNGIICSTAISNPLFDVFAVANQTFTPYFQMYVVWPHLAKSALWKFSLSGICCGGVSLCGPRN